MFTTVSIGAATVWFSTHCGAGFASGTQELQYFATMLYGTLLPFLNDLLSQLLIMLAQKLQDRQIIGIIMTGRWKRTNRLMYSAVMIEITVVTTTASAAWPQRALRWENNSVGLRLRGR